ncbi:YgfZ/GcvT domain-containing protein [Candidatus Methylobacter oryzae]|uniref:Folate-binding protein YgfZ n=1 Tax=Candidatus Methylobacter oryzae TaxID=2497749 RepID=A0ABY3CA58_9GAMM|nr:folate-binding protein YgfZ [Candidatus Methylobacter oryzae]TRW94739.1 folate-binding protein YgfZ [Candidatus Methylobacter oryzae]
MNADWKNFLLAENAIFKNDIDITFPSSDHKSSQCIYAITDLGILAVAGADAAKFLQGQITCNINDISETKSSLGAMCNPKGRAITTFLLVKNADVFLMVLPKVLLEAVKKKLQMYVLRSKVVLTDSSDQLCLIGLSDGVPQPVYASEQLFATNRQEYIVVNLQNRSLIIAEVDHAKEFWKEQAQLGFQAEDSAQWRYLDIISGIPWLTAETSEEFIPQMLNLDKLGGISFNKGCYTGQEIVARTHYLGKAKREMFLAECDVLAALPEPNSTIIDDSIDTEQSTGKVLYAQNGQDSCKMLVVLQISDTDTYNLRLKNDNQDKIRLLR